MCIIYNGIVISTPLAQVRVCGRKTSGVKIMNLEGRQKIVSIAIVPHEEPSDETEVEGEEVESEAAPVAEEFKDTSVE